MAKMLECISVKGKKTKDWALFHNTSRAAEIKILNGDEVRLGSIT